MLLHAEDLKIFYGPVEAIHGISFDVNEGEIVSIVGNNGAGKTTILKTIFCGTILKCTFAMVRARNLGLWEHRLHRLTLRIWIHLRANAKRSATTLISIISWRL